MVQVIENATDLEGRVEVVEPHPSWSGWQIWSLRILRAKPVQDLPDLVKARPGDLVKVAMPPEVLKGDAPEGGHLRCRACLAGPDSVRLMGPPDTTFDFCPPDRS